MPEYKISTTSKADAADIFYCEQAIWEALPLGKRVTADIDGTIEFKSNIGNEPEHAKWTELHSADRSVVKLHFVPASVKRRTIVAFDVSAAENVVVMRVSDVKNPKLQAFRQEWFTFLDSHGRLDGEDLDQQKRLMRKKYESLFLHP